MAERGLRQFLTPSVFLGSNQIPSPETIWRRKAIYLNQNSHLLNVSNNYCPYESLRQSSNGLHTHPHSENRSKCRI